MADATELVSLANLKAWIRNTTADKDAILQSIKDGVEEWVKNYCQRDFIIATFTEYYDGDGTTELLVRNNPITWITSIHDDGARDFGDASLISSDNIISNDAEGWAAGIVELFLDSFSRGTKNIKIIYLAGYATVPADLQMAVKKICAKIYFEQDKGLAGRVSQTVGDKVIELSLDTIPKDAKLILDSYRRIGP